MALGSSNPTISKERFARAASEETLVNGQPMQDPGTPGGPSSNRMTVSGAVNKAALLIAVVVGVFTLQWSWIDGSTSDTPLYVGFGAGIVAVIMSLVISFKPHIAPVAAVPFAALEGLMLGSASWQFEQYYPGIVFQAILGTAAVFVAMLSLWRAGIIRLGPRGRRIVTTAFFGLFIMFSMNFLLGMIGINVPGINDGGPIGIGISLFVIGIAALMLTIDFDMITEGERYGAPKYMEWYSGFALLVTLVWIYIEMLRLIAAFRD